MSQTAGEDAAADSPSEHEPSSVRSMGSIKKKEATSRGVGVLTVKIVTWDKSKPTPLSATTTSPDLGRLGWGGQFAQLCCANGPPHPRGPLQSRLNESGRAVESGGRGSALQTNFDSTRWTFAGFVVHLVPSLAGYAGTQLSRQRPMNGGELPGLLAYLRLVSRVTFRLLVDGYLRSRAFVARCFVTCIVAVGGDRTPPIQDVPLQHGGDPPRGVGLQSEAWPEPPRLIRQAAIQSEYLDSEAAGDAAVQDATAQACR